MTRCDACRWWFDGECRAAPPSAVYIPAREFRDDFGPRRDSARVDTVWPSTRPHDFCGKWEGKESA